MDLHLKNKHFLVCGAGSGFGKAIALRLAEEGAQILAVSRTVSKLKSLQKHYPSNIEILAGDLYDNAFHSKIAASLSHVRLSGALINAGGPPAGGFFDVSDQEWDEGWKTVVRWKIGLTRLLIGKMKPAGYGRLLYIESVSVKQPVENLILSNALRPAVTGFVKTVSQEVAAYGITMNVLAPGYHLTEALQRLFVKKAQKEKISEAEAKKQFEAEIPVGTLATPGEITGLAAWLLSPLSRYVTGQVFSHDGGIVKGFFG